MELKKEIVSARIQSRRKELNLTLLMGWEKTPEQMEQEDKMILEAYHRASPELQEAIQRILKGQ